jgi:hypothetical protein
MLTLTAAVAFAVSTWCAGAAQAGFASSNVTYWIGSGTNDAILVIDWNDGIDPQSLAWGVRWNGEMTGAELMEKVRESDTKFRYRYHPAFPGSAVYAIGHDTGYDRMTVLEGQPGIQSETGFAFDLNDHYREGWFSGFWSFWESVGAPFEGGAWQKATVGLSTGILTNGTWLGWGYDADFSSNFGGLEDAPDEPAAARSEYATRVVEYVPGSGIGFDTIDFAPFDDPLNALGRPTIDTTGEGIFLPETNPVPVVAVSPPFRAFELVSIGGGGRLTLAFDHPVLDEPDNPFGIDVIVYGNAFFNIEGGGSWMNGNPSNTTITGVVESEPGLVSVSQDGTNWFPLAGGPFADTFAPTLGRRFAPGQPVAIPGMTNAWWGSPTDPTFPLDPSLDAADIAGKTVADAARLFGASSGGTGFDIGSLSLPQHPVEGVKWFQFIRIERNGLFNPEIDAVADVGPGLPYSLWQISHFNPTNRIEPAIAGGGADPDGDLIANLFEYLTGRDPHVADAGPLFDAAVTSDATGSVFDVVYTIREDARDTRVLVEYTEEMVTWSTDGIDQSYSSSVSTAGTQTVTAQVPATTDRRSVRLRGVRP